jgi:hypothetical protein
MSSIEVSIGSGSGDVPLDEFKLEYPKRKLEIQDKEPIDFSVDESELFDCYVRSDTE